MSPITTHILDTHRGCPASGVSIELRKLTPEGFVVLTKKNTNADGRIPDLLPKGSLEPGVYQMQFDTKSYHASLGIQGFYPEVVVCFEIQNIDQHYHIPLLISPFGYSTYRGS